MLLALTLLCVAFLSELISIGLADRLHRISGGITICLLAICTLVLCFYPGYAVSGLVFINLYRIFNMLRLMSSMSYRRHAAALYKTSLYLGTAQIVIGLLWLVSSLMYTTYSVGLTLTGAICLMLVLFSYRLLRNHTQSVSVELSDDARDLPSVTVAIPARNETDDLEACLRSFIASDYPKLEIIALDDCSQTARTPELIRQFAHDGVRFIPGEPLKKRWLAKNQAYESLAKAASGEIILFCGVDVRVEPASIRHLVTHMQNQRVTMLGLLPRNALDHGRISLIQLMRYAREFIRPSRRRPLMLSTCWLIHKSALETVGGFSAVSQQIYPENYFARTLEHTKAYTFLAAYNGVTTYKKLDEQQATAVRTLYPTVHKRPELVMLQSVAELTLVLLPFVLLASSVLTGDWWLALLSAGIFLVSVLLCRLLIIRMYGAGPGWQALRYAAGLLSDVWLLNYSMYKYEFSVVEWKGRNICEPVMHIEPHLPKLD